MTSKSPVFGLGLAARLAVNALAGEVAANKTARKTDANPGLPRKNDAPQYRESRFPISVIGSPLCCFCPVLFRQHLTTIGNGFYVSGQVDTRSVDIWMGCALSKRKISAI